MFYDKELAFFQSILKNYHIQSFFAAKDAVTSSNPDIGLFKLLGQDAELPFSRFLEEQMQHNIFYQITDSFYCHYILFLLPHKDPDTAMIIGPYICSNISRQFIYQLADKYNLPPALLPQLEKFYTGIPSFSDDNMLHILLNTLGEKMWGSLEHFSIHTINSIPNIQDSFTMSSQNGEVPSLAIQILEDRYAIENRLMQAVSQGQPNKAESILGSLSFSAMEERTPDPLRDLKNYSIILNTLMRKAAEAGYVHPLHIDKLSSDFARKIEQLNGKEAGLKLLRDMIHKYCLLVKNHSMKSYSLLVQRVITQIDLDLTADLSLKTQAKLQNVNASYLSSLFKKETGITLTEYVNRKRIDQAIFLLNSTSLQIQTIAQHCGISDVNYFTKTFKKYIGKTPREYRDNILFYES